MQQLNEKIFQQSDINQYTYQAITQPKVPSSALFRHDDQSINKVTLFKSEGYVSLCVLPEQPQSIKPSADQRRAMFQNRSKPSVGPKDLPQWTQPNDQQNIQTLMTKEAGWKFHLSIAQDPANIEKAWSALVPILLKHKVGQTKIVLPENQQVANKVITVYTFNGGPKLDQWAPFLNDVESAFLQCGVVPGEQIYENHVTGSLYSYYRNDAGHNGEYVKDEYHFLFRVVDEIPLSELQMSKLATELDQTKNVVGCVIKVKDSDICILHIPFDKGWTSKDFNVNHLNTLENRDQHQLITISPLINRQAYVELVVPELNKAIPSTNNVTKEPDPFKSTNLTQSMDQSISRSMK